MYTPVGIVVYTIILYEIKFLRNKYDYSAIFFGKISTEMM